MAKLGYGEKEESFAHKRVEEGTRAEQPERGETVFSSDDES